MSKYAERSRLSRKLIKQSEKKLLFVLIGTVIIIFCIIKFGIPFLLFLSGNTSNTNDTTQVASNKQTFLIPPILNSTFTATNSAQIKVTGISSANEKITLFINNQSADSVSTNSDGTFSFDNVNLQEGDNTIQAKAKANNKTSNYSNTLTVAYKNKAPSLDITSPSDGQTFNKVNNTQVVGKTDPDSTVMVNDFRAIVDGNGGFTYSLQLQNGDNQLKIIATDNAGNKTEKDLKVTSNQ